jgi:predicted ATP-dependent serine protease
MTGANGVALSFDTKVITPSSTQIQRLCDIPSIQTMEIKPVEYLVPGVISRGSVTMWAGAPGVAKTYLSLAMAIAVATGGEFLGRRCRQCKTLVIDYENPAHEVRSRIDLLTKEVLIPDLHIWGIFQEQQPPRIGSPTLLSIAHEEQPLVIFDPFRNSHGCDENSSSEMAGVLEQLVYMKSRGAAVIFLHHIAKSEGSVSRGSSAIDGAVDVSLLQTMDPESGLIELKTTKNRFGEPYKICIRPDFAEGTFEITDSPEFTKRTAESEKLLQIIIQNQGLSQNALWKQSKMMKARCVSLLKQGNGTLWREEKQGSSLRYFPLVLKTQNNSENNRTGQGIGSCSPVLSLKGENREQLPLDPAGCSENRLGKANGASGIQEVI